jgi:hypothetical protein
MNQILISFKPYESSVPSSQIHDLGNIADNVWPEKLSLIRGVIKEGQYYGEMELINGDKLRKKEKDEIRQRLKLLEKSDPDLEPKFIYNQEK